MRMKWEFFFGFKNDCQPSPPQPNAVLLHKAYNFFNFSLKFSFISGLDFITLLLFLITENYLMKILQRSNVTEKEENKISCIAINFKGNRERRSFTCF